ncbi:MAG: hypothetical protein AAF986_08750, partial [Pseudomonadota bacterium]
ALHFIDTEASRIVDVQSEKSSVIVRGSKALHFTGLGLVCGGFLALASAAPFLIGHLLPSGGGIVKTIPLFEGAAVAPWPLAHAAIGIALFTLFASGAARKFARLKTELSNAVTALFAEGRLLDPQSAARFSPAGSSTDYWTKKLATTAPEQAKMQHREKNTPATEVSATQASAGAERGTSCTISQTEMLVSMGKRPMAPTRHLQASNKVRLAPITDQDRQLRSPRPFWQP